MFTIPAENRGTQIFMHALSASIAMAAEGGAVYLDLSGIDEERPAARKVLVEEHLTAVLRELEAVIRAKTITPEASPAVLGSRLIANGESDNVLTHRYTAGPGFETLLKALAAEADAAYEKAAGDGGSTY
jgi:hypothetical protein